MIATIYDCRRPFGSVTPNHAGSNLQLTLVNTFFAEFFFSPDPRHQFTEMAGEQRNLAFFATSVMDFT